ncbi:MAG TPA: hypothetical protein VFP86_02220 [bacterium]|nr:hypothetical protein [bacterium]
MPVRPRQGDGAEPVEAGLPEQVADGWRLEGVMTQQRVDAVLHHRLDADQKHPLAEDPLDGPGLLRGCIGFRDEVGAEEVGEGFGIDLVGLDSRVRDRAHFRRVGEHNFIHELIEPVVHRPPRETGFEDGLQGFVVAFKRVPEPGRELDTCFRCRTLPASSITVMCDVAL